jgi:hypothetical protein
MPDMGLSTTVCGQSAEVQQLKCSHISNLNVRSPCVGGLEYAKQHYLVL